MQASTRDNDKRRKCERLFNLLQAACTTLEEIEYMTKKITEDTGAVISLLDDVDKLREDKGAGVPFL